MKKLLLIICCLCFFPLAFTSETSTASFAINYLNKTELFVYQKHSSKNIIDADLSFSEYSYYLQDSFKEIPFSKILYLPASYLWSTGNMVFLFDAYNISSVIFQAIQTKKDFQRVADAHNKEFGTPLYASIQGQTLKYVWETNSGNILLSHTVRPLGFTLQNMVAETPHPGFAFMDLENITFAESLRIWKVLRENDVIDINGISIAKDLDSKIARLDQTLESLNLSSFNLQKLKVMLIATAYGETNIFYLNKNNSLITNSPEDENFEIMLQ